MEPVGGHGWAIEETGEVGDRFVEVEQNNGTASGTTMPEKANQKPNPPRSRQPPTTMIAVPAPPALLRILGVETRAQRSRRLSTDDGGKCCYSPRSNSDILDTPTDTSLDILADYNVLVDECTGLSGYAPGQKTADDS